MDMPPDAITVFDQEGVVMAVEPDKPGTYVFASDGVDLSSAYWMEAYPVDQRADWIMVGDAGPNAEMPDGTGPDAQIVPDPFEPVIIDMGVLAVGHDLIVA